MKYLKEIDGLRALAVLSVVLYHAGIYGIPGGFVGVDIFFVISGYLITRTISDDREAGRFSIIDFYQRRARRILPALFFMIVIVSALSAVILLPEHFKRFGASLIALTFFSSNFYFWLRVESTGYFAEAARNFPLLHTWSLSVEEQFYLFFPLLLVLTLGKNRGRGFTIAAIGLIAVVSFGLNVWLSSTRPQAAFYAAPARAWELLIGAICSFAPSLGLHRRLIREMVATIGVGLMLIAIGSFSEAMQFPGYRATLPTMGAAMLILAAANGSTFVGSVMTTKPVRFFGLISYSLYLWHWPLLTLAAYYAIDPLTPLQIAAILAVSVIMASISWRYVEQPVRTKRVLPSRKSIFVYAGIAALCCLGIGIFTQTQNGIAFRGLAREARLENYHKAIDSVHSHCMLEADASLDNFAPCLFNQTAKQQIVLWGDSHSDAFLPSVVAAANQTGVALTYYGEAGCPPVPGLIKGSPKSFLFSGSRTQCDAFNATVLQRILADPDPSLVILAARWGTLVRGTWGYRQEDKPTSPFQILDTQNNEIRDPQRLDLIAANLQTLVAQLQHAGKTVAVIYPVPEIGYNVPLTAARIEMYHRHDLTMNVPVAKYRQEESGSIRMLDGLGPDVIRIHPEALMCDSSECRVSENDDLLYYDDNHINTYATVLFQPVIAQAIRSWENQS